MKTRIKTKQEFREAGDLRACGRPENWTSSMNYLYGLPAVPGGRKELYPELAPGDSGWHINDYHVTIEPHPYDKANLKLRVTPAESKKVQLKCFALGYKWGGGDTEVDKLDKPFLFITFGKLTFAEKSEEDYYEEQSNTEITFKMFMNGELPEEEPVAKRPAADRSAGIMADIAAACAKAADAYISDERLLRVWDGKKVFTDDVRNAFKYNLLSSYEFKEKYNQIKLGSYAVSFDEDKVHVGCMTFSRAHVRVVADMLKKAKQHDISPTAILEFIEKYEGKTEVE